MKVEIYQKASDITAPLLTQIINDCFKKKYFLAQHKKAELSLIYIHRNKHPQDAKSYQLICLLNIQRKIIEKMIYIYIYIYIRLNNTSMNKTWLRTMWLYKGKIYSGCNKLYIIGKIKSRESIYVLGLFVDFSDAFDRIPWLKFFSLLRDLQISSYVYNILQFYFEDREILIRIPEYIARKRINRRCPQESIFHIGIHIMEYISGQSIEPSR